MANETKSVYVDGNKVKLLNQKGYTLTDVAKSAMDVILSEEFEDLAVNTKINELNKSINELKSNIILLEASLEGAKTQLIRLVEQREHTEKEWERAKATSVVLMKTRSLNKLIISSQYDLDMLQDHPDVIELVTYIANYTPGFTLEKQVMRMKKNSVY